MSRIAYTAPIIVDGVAISEMDAVIDYTVSSDNGDHVISVDQIICDGLTLNINSVGSTASNIFLDAKEALEADERFINRALENHYEAWGRAA